MQFVSVSSFKPVNYDSNTNGLNLNTTKIITSDGGEFVWMNGTCSAADVVTQNFNNVVLSPLTKSSNVFTYNTGLKPLKKITTTLSFAATLELNEYTFYVKADVEGMVPGETKDLQLIAAADISYNNSYYFTLEMNEIEGVDNTCVIYHEVNSSEGDVKYYIDLDEATGKFVVVRADDNYIVRQFRYIYDPHGYLSLYTSSASGAVYVGGDFSVSPPTLAINFPEPGTEPFNSNNILNIIPTQTSTNNYNKTSWVSYGNNMDVNADKSSLDINENFLLFTNFENDAKVSILPLKNTMTNSGQVSRGGVFIDENKNHRYYTTIHVESKQEEGPKQLILNSIIYSNDVVLKSDKTTHFQTSDTVYPFNQLNINDSRLAYIGAIGGDSPINSDKIYKVYNYETATSSAANIGRQLCTWLSASPDGQMIWLDRYYNPAKYTADEIMGALNIDYIRALSSSDAYDNFVNQYNYLSLYDVYDKRSDLCFVPNMEYKYNRIGSTYVSDYLEKYNKDICLSGLTTVINDAGASEYSPSAVCDGKTYAISEFLDHTKWNQYTLSLIIDRNDWSEPFAHTIVGNNTNNGISLINNPLFTPILLVPTVSGIYSYNTNLEQIGFFKTSADIKQIYREDHNNTFGILDTNNNVQFANPYGLIPDYPSNISSDTVTSYDYNKIITSESIDDDGVHTVTYLKVYDNHIDQVIEGSIFTYTDTVSSVMLSGTNIIDAGISSSKDVHILHSDGTNYGVTTIDTFGHITKFTNISSVMSGVSAAPISMEIIFDSVSGTSSEKFLFALSGINNEHKLITTDNSFNIINSVLVGSIDAYSSLHKCHSIIQSNKYADVSNNNAILKVTLSDNTAENHKYFEIIPSIDISKLTAGPHQFSVIIDTQEGQITYYIDGTVCGIETFEGKTFNYVPIINKPLFAGIMPFFNNISIADYTGIKYQGTSTDNTVVDLRIYSGIVKYYDMLFIYRQFLSFNDIVFPIPAGMRNIEDEIDSIFKTTIPGSNVSDFNVIVNNINDIGLSDTAKDMIKQEIIEVASKYIPGTSTIKQIYFND